MRTCFFIILFIFTIATANATVRTVSNYPANLAQHNTIQSAIDASASGDSIYIHGSPTSYGSFSITNKKLTLIGPGYLPDKALAYAASINTSDINGDLSSGCRFEGLVIAGQLSFNGADSSHFLRNYFNGGSIYISPTFASYSGIVIEGNYFSNFNNVIVANYPIYNTSIQNNVFYKGTILGIQNGGSVLINHNLFYGPANIAIVTFVNCNNLTIANNIFVRRNAGSGNANSSFNNNIAYLCDENTPWAMNGNIDVIGNISNQNPQMVDEALVEAGTLSLLLNYTIAAGPANNSGSDSKDMGLLYDPTGFYNWAYSHVSRLPYLYSMNISNPVIQTNGSINVTIEARKSN